jgi:hypothetical protein
MSSAHSEIEALYKECLRRLTSIRKGDEDVIDSAETTQAARARLDEVMEGFPMALAVAIGYRPRPAVLQNKGFAAALAKSSPEGAKEIQKVRLAASLLDRQLQDELRAFRQRKGKKIEIRHANQEDRELLRALKLLLLQNKIDADQDLIFQAAVRHALKLPGDRVKEAVNDLTRDRRLAKASEEGEPSTISVWFGPENIPALHRLEWLLRQPEAAIGNRDVVLQMALRMAPTGNELTTEVMNVLDRKGGRKGGYVLVSGSEGRKITFLPTAQDQRLIMKLRDLLADEGLAGVADPSIIRAAVALLELPNADFVDHARESVDARTLLKKGVRDGEDYPSKVTNVRMTSEQLLRLKTFLLRAGVDAAAADILRAAIRCVKSGAELASKLASQKQASIQELRKQGQRAHPSEPTSRDRKIPGEFRNRL